MISASSSCFPHNPNGFQMYGVMEEMLSLSPPTTAVDAHAHSNSLLYNLSILRDKVEQLESIVSMVVSTDPIQRHSAAMAATGAGGLVQEIIVAASSMMFAFQQLATSTSMASSTGVHVKVIDEGPHPTRASNEVMGQGDVLLHGPDGGSGCTRGGGRGFSGGDGVYDGYNTNYNSSSSNKNSRFFDNSVKVDEKVELPSEEFHDISPVAAGAAFDVIELDAADLLAKYTHYCQVCGKGFKRDANLRMHMRAHGDEYKTNAALSNPMKKNNNNNGGGGAMGFNDYSTTTETTPSRKYSCPQEGCRWNRKHAKFQPLKSMVCVKNHYRRSHCPKMYVCNRCNRKQFSVLSDLRTHEKHCGDLKWRCSCGTTFSRKDKLMGHVALFVGHAPAIVT